MSGNATAVPPPVSECAGICEATARTIGMVFMCLSAIALAGGVVTSLLESLTRFRMRVYRSQATVAQENSFKPGRDPFALLHCLQIMAVVSLGDGKARNRIPAALEAFTAWFQFSNLQIPALSMFKHYGLRHTCDDRALDQFLGTVELNVVLLVGTCVLREILRLAVLAWAKQVRGEPHCPGFLLFRHWELQLFLTQSMGHSIAGGKAIASTCIGWQIIGASAVFFVPFLFMVILHFHVRNAIEGSARLVYFDGAKWAGDLLLTRKGTAGVWRSMPGRPYPQSHFLQLYSKYFERFRPQCWSFATIMMLKRLLTGISFAFPNVKHRCAAIFLLCLAELLCMLVVQPHTEFKLFVRSVLGSLCHTIAFGLLLLHKTERIPEAAATTLILVFEILAGVLALCDQVLVVTEEFEEIHRNIQDGDFFRAEDKHEILALAVKARHEKQMEEQRRVALAKIQEREMLEKPLVEKLLAEDSKKKESSETKEDKGPGPLYVTRKRLVELGHWTNDPFVKKAEEPGPSYLVPGIRNSPVAQPAAAILPPPQIWSPTSIWPVPAEQSASAPTTIMSELVENVVGTLDLDRFIAHQIQRKKDIYGGTQTPRRNQPARSTLSRKRETLAPGLTRTQSSGFAATSATPAGKTPAPPTPRQTLPEHLEIEQKPSEQKPLLLRQHDEETAQLPDEKQPLSSAASQLRESVASVAHPIPPAINFEVSQAPPARPPRLAAQAPPAARRDGDGAGRSARGETALQNGAHANAGPDETRDASVSIRKRMDESKNRMALLQSQVRSRSHASSLAGSTTSKSIYDRSD